MSGAIIEYRVQIGPYAVNLTMLNVDGLSRKSNRRELGNGSFGSVFEHNVNTILKRVYFVEGMSILLKSYDGADWLLKSNHQ